MKKIGIFFLIIGFLALAMPAAASSPERFTDGVTTAAPSETMGQYILPDRTKIHEYWNDFNRYETTDFVLTTVEAGPGAATETITSTVGGGWLQITNDSSEDDGDFFQASDDGGTNDSEVFTYVSGKKAWFKCSFKANSATQSDILIGVHITDTTPIAGAPSDGIWFVKDDGDTNIDIVVTINSTATRANAIATLSADTTTTLGYYWDGMKTLRYYVNDTYAGSLTLSSSALPSDEFFAVSFGIQNGEATNSQLLLDYIWAAEER